MTPKIHCSLTPNGFSDVYPHYDMSLLYENRHLSHLKSVGHNDSYVHLPKYRYSLAMIMDLKPNTYLIFNEEGEIVNEIMNNNNTEYTIIGHRLFNVSLAQDLNWLEKNICVFNICIIVALLVPLFWTTKSLILLIPFSHLRI